MLRRPLRATLADQQRFVVPPERDRIRAALEAGRNVLLIGPRRSGRTSLINHLAGRDERDWAVTGGEGAPSPAALLLLVLEALGDGQDLGEVAAIAAGEVGLVGPALTARLLDRLEVATSPRDRPVVIAIDGIAPLAGYELFGAQRNEVWALSNVVWLVGCDEGDVDLLTAPPGDAFWDERVVLSAPDAERAAALLAAHDVEGPARGLGRPVGELVADPQATAVAPPAIAGTAGRLLDWIRVHGPASASDPALQRHLGVSRQRVSQLLLQLADDGLLTRHDGYTQTGRPRAAYALTENRPA